MDKVDKYFNRYEVLTLKKHKLLSEINELDKEVAVLRQRMLLHIKPQPFLSRLRSKS